MNFTTLLPLPITRSLNRLGQAFSLARHPRHLMQQDLAERIGASAITVRRMESGYPGTALLKIFIGDDADGRSSETAFLPESVFACLPEKVRFLPNAAIIHFKGMRKSAMAPTWKQIRNK